MGGLEKRTGGGSSLGKGGEGEDGVKGEVVDGQDDISEAVNGTDELDPDVTAGVV